MPRRGRRQRTRGEPRRSVACRSLTVASERAARRSLAIVTVFSDLEHRCDSPPVSTVCARGLGLHPESLPPPFRDRYGAARCPLRRPTRTAAPAARRASPPASPAAPPPAHRRPLRRRRTRRAASPAGGTATPNRASPRVTTHATRIPSGSPTAAPISDVVTASWRTMRRVCLRVIPTARRAPISRVRSITASARALTIPRSAVITASTSSIVSSVTMPSMSPWRFAIIAGVVRRTASGNTFSRAASAAVSAPGCQVDEGERVGRLRERRVERLLRDHDVPEQRVEPRRCEHATDDVALRLARGAEDGDPVPDDEILLLGQVVADERSGRAERRKALLRALLPREAVGAVDRGRVDPAHVDLLLADLAAVVAHRAERAARRERRRSSSPPPGAATPSPSPTGARGTSRSATRRPRPR